MTLSKLIPETEARNIVLSNVQPVGTEYVPVKLASGRILADDLRSLRTQPPFDASAMDGYAVKYEDILGAPKRLALVGVSRAGEPFDGSVETGEAVRIFTGAVVPEGANTVVIQENTTVDGESVEILTEASKGKYIRSAGLDFEKGDLLLSTGDVLSPNRLALAASMNHDTLPVYKKPKVAIIATGDELVQPGQDVGPGQIIASNTYGLIAAAQIAGAEVVDMGIVGDTAEALKSALTEAIETGCNLIVTTGGASVGDHDLVMPTAEECGFKFSISKIAMRPGKPFLYGIRSQENETVRITGLAGNPVSSLVAFSVFVRPLIQLLSGRDADTIGMKNAKLGCSIPQNDERAEYMRATLQTDAQGEIIATPFDIQDSSMLANLVRADCLIYREVNAPNANVGDLCEYVPLVNG